MSQKEYVTHWFAEHDAKNYTSLRGMLDNNHKFHNPTTPEPIGAGAPQEA